MEAEASASANDQEKLSAVDPDLVFEPEGLEIEDADASMLNDDAEDPTDPYVVKKVQRALSSTPRTVDLPLKTMLAVSSHDRNHQPKRDYTAIVIDVHTAFLHADIDQDLFAGPPDGSELREDEVWKLHKALYGYRKAPKPWHQHVVTLRGSLNVSTLMTGLSCFSNVELNIHMFIHVDDVLLFGPSIEIQRLS